MYVVLPPKRLRVLSDWGMFLKPMAERIYTTIEVYQVSQLGSGVVVASTTDPKVARAACDFFNQSPMAEEIISAIRHSFFHTLPGFATADVLTFPKRE